MTASERLEEIKAQHAGGRYWEEDIPFLLARIEALEAEYAAVANAFNDFILKEREEHGLRGAPWIPEDRWMLGNFRNPALSSPSSIKEDVK